MCAILTRSLNREMICCPLCMIGGKDTLRVASWCASPAVGILEQWIGTCGA